MSVHENHPPQVCPKTGEPVAEPAKRRWWVPWVFPFLGAASLTWFLIRVIPKPSRAAYPCQRIAAPLASTFVLWLLGVCAALGAWCKVRSYMRRPRLALAGVSLLIGLIGVWLALSGSPQSPAQAAYHPANSPVGTARGLNPGRVVWVHDPAATTWDGQSLGQIKGYWGRVGSDPDEVIESYTNQAIVDAMLINSVRWLAGKQDIYEAWDALIRHFNSTKGKGAVGYQAGEKINIKINLTTTSGGLGWVVNTSGTQTRDRQYAAPSVEVMIALLRQLTLIVGVSQSDITMGDTTGTIPNHVYNQLVDAGFDQVVYICKNALPGRVVDTQTAEVLKFSGPGVGDMHTPVPATYANADYFINLAILKTHARAGVTMCAKNMYGSMIRTPTQGGYYDLHASLACNVSEDGSYRGLVDLMGHEKFGGNQLLCIIDALWGGYDWSWVSPPIRWQTPPFDNHWCSSILVSQDPVAIDSVGYDIWWAESEVTTIPGASTSPYADPRMLGADDYLCEAAMADNPDSGTIYDPEDDGSRLASLGAHEHWNNRFDRQYSRNLGTGDGIELITAEPTEPSSVEACHIFYNRSRYDGGSSAAEAADDNAIAPDKLPLLPGGTAGFANYTSYSRGINGVMVDIADLANAGGLSADDFEFHVGNTPLTGPPEWDQAPAPQVVAVREGAGADDSDRVTLTWADNAIQKKWLRITVKANGNTGLTSPYVFYFGNAIGETGNSATDAHVTPTDEIGTRNNPHTLAMAPADILDVYDFNRDGKVGPTDEILARNNATSSGTALILLEAP
jgi:uncharacterized protein DUF362